MPVNALVRLASILSIFILVQNTSESACSSIFFSCALAHYFIGFVYSKNRTLEIIKQPKSYLPSLFIVAAGALAIFYRFPLWVYFGTHHVLSEFYRINNPKFISENRSLVFSISCFMLNSFGYLFIIRNQQSISWLPAKYVLSAFLVSSVVFFCSLYQNRTAFPKNLLFDRGLFEGINILLVFGSLFFTVNYRQVILYHAVSWAVFSGFRVKEKGQLPLIRYLILTFVINGVLLFLSPSARMPFQISFPTLSNQVDLWGYIHITASFALSSSNPKWITKWFSNRDTSGLQAKQGTLLQGTLIN